MADNLEFLKSERFTTEMAYFIPLSHLLISLGHFNAINILVYLKVSSVQCWNMHAMLLHCEFCSHIFFYFLFFCEWLCICKPSLPSRSLCLHFWCAVWFHLGMALFFFFFLLQWNNLVFSFLHHTDKVEIVEGKVTLCRDAAKGKCMRTNCKYYHVPVTATNGILPATASANATAASATF